MWMNISGSALGAVPGSAICWNTTLVLPESAQEAKATVNGLGSSTVGKVRKVPTSSGALTNR